MFLDNDLALSSSQAVSSTGVGTNTIDLAAARSVGSGEPVSVLFVVEVAADQTSGDEDYQFDVEFASAANQGSGQQSVGRRLFESGTPTAPAQNADLLVAGFQFSINIPPVSGDEDERYLGVRYTLSGTSPSVTVSAYVVPTALLDNPKVSYASGYSVA